MLSNLTFITNEDGRSLRDRFNVLIKDSRYFDCLVGYFYISGFHTIYKSLENAERIRILIGIGTSQETFDYIRSGNLLGNYSHKEVKDIISQKVKNDIDQSEDNNEAEEGIVKFIEWIRKGKLEVRAYPSQNVHSKLYIVTFKEGYIDKGRIITGSSNFTKRGFSDNLEFNVELTRDSDFQFASEKFENLWNVSVEVSEKFVQAVDKSWIKPVLPYELYLKFLYEFFREDLEIIDDSSTKYSDDFMDFEYQKQAVVSAKKILEKYGGVFLSDVVGLGKTYMAAMLARQLQGNTIVIAPPVLLEKSNPGSYRNVFWELNISAQFESIGKLNHILKNINLDKIDNVIIDEAHRFRNESNKTYDQIAQICRGKKVILVTATPYNNSPEDLLSQIKLFQNVKNSNIPGVANLEGFFGKLQRKLKNLDRQKDKDEFLAITRANAKEIRDKVLRHIMIRRTRSDIVSVFPEDIAKNNIKFPEIEDPEPLYYEMNDKENSVFDRTVELITKNFTYSRYTPLLYLKKGLSAMERQAQRNMGGFMKILLIKRLESSFYAFKKSIERFVQSYELFLREFDRGNVYISKKYNAKLLELLNNDDDDAIEELIESGKARQYQSSSFEPKLRQHLLNDIEILKEIKKMWSAITRDPKLIKMKQELQKSKILRENKIIIFTESKETAEYLYNNIEQIEDKTLCFTGSSKSNVRDEVIDNFNAKAYHPKDDFRILISTDVLSEGVNLHRSNVVINYDIPWNPTRMMQRVGRVNRIDTKFDKIYIYNFFPTIQSNNIIKLKEAAVAKIHAFLTLLGGDSLLLTEGEPVESHSLFETLTSKRSITDSEEEEDRELPYFKIIKDIREKDPDLFEKIKRLPKKARSSKHSDQLPNNLITYFRKGGLDKFFATAKNKQPKELTFIEAAKLLQTEPGEKMVHIPRDYFELLNNNKEAFNSATVEDEVEQPPSRDKAKEIIKILKYAIKDTRQYTEEQESFLQLVLERSSSGSLSKKTIKNIEKALKELGDKIQDRLRVYAVFKNNVPQTLLKEHYAEQKGKEIAKREIILSMFLQGDKR